MKRKILISAVVVICLAILASGSIAYFTAEEEVHNVITSGAVDIEIDVPNDEIEIMPGTKVSKMATVKNLDAAAYVRAKFECAITDANDELMALSPEELDEIVIVNVDDTNWVRKEGDNEWWYYSKSIETDDVVEMQFEVSFSGPNMTNEYQSSTVTIAVKAQAVQTANNQGSVLEADGWPETMN